MMRKTLNEKAKNKISVKGTSKSTVYLYQAI